MTADVLRAVAHAHAERLRVLGVVAAQADTRQPGAPRDTQAAHALWMLDRVRALAVTDCESAARCLAFVQGVLWGLGHHSLLECDLTEGGM